MIDCSKSEKLIRYPPFLNKWYSKFTYPAEWAWNLGTELFSKR